MYTKTILSIGLLLMPVLSFAESAVENELEALRAASRLPENQQSVGTPATSKQWLNEITETFDAANPSLSRKAGKNTDTAKIEALKGSWIISYKILNSYTDKLVINEVEVDKDGVWGIGETYINTTGSPKVTVCQYDPSRFAKLGGDYLCLAAVGENMYGYSISFSGNTITGGYYSIGDDSSTLLFDGLEQKLFPITGYRESPNAPQATTDVYNSATGELTLPRVQVGKAHYAVVLTNIGNNNFRLTKAEPIPATGTSADVYNATTGELNLPHVQVGNSAYKVVMTFSGNSVFRLKSAVQK